MSVRQQQPRSYLHSGHRTYRFYRSRYVSLNPVICLSCVTSKMPLDVCQGRKAMIPVFRTFDRRLTRLKRSARTSNNICDISVWVDATIIHSLHRNTLQDPAPTRRVHPRLPPSPPPPSPIAG